jgi:hypothetical protein
MLAPGLDGTWSSKRLTTADCTVWMRELMLTVADVERTRALGLGSHSLKATMLSWAAKFGMPAGPRRKLGGHVKPGDRSLVEYSRDEMAGPLRELDKVVEAVRLGIFLPDCTRSGRFVHDQVAEDALEQQFPAAGTPVVVLDSSISDSGSASSESLSVESELADTDALSSSDENLAAAVAEDMIEVPVDPNLPALPELGVVRNLTNGLLHGARDSKRLICGRAYPVKHHAMQAWPKRAFPLCRDCFKPSHLTK